MTDMCISLAHHPPTKKNEISPVITGGSAQNVRQNGNNHKVALEAGGGVWVR